MQNNVELINIIKLITLAYFLGSIPFAFIFGKIFKNIDIRKEGSGNIGASNAFRVLGVKIGILVMFFDIFKGFLPVYITKNYNYNEYILFTIGFFAIIGHMFPIFLKFKGGKGVATTAGVFLAITPKSTILCIALWSILALITKIASISSITVSILFPILVYYLDKSSQLTIIISILLSSFIIIMHHKNIKNLILGKELKLTNNPEIKKE